MAELIVVSAIIVITLTGLYISYHKIITSYRQVINYYDIGLYYKLGYYNMKLYKAGTLTTTLNSIDDDKYSNITTAVVDLETGTKESIFIVKNKNGIKALKNTVANQTYKDYLEYLLNSKDIGDGYYIIGEQCLTSKTKCKYAYAEVSNA